MKAFVTMVALFGVLSSGWAADGNTNLPSVKGLRLGMTLSEATPVVEKLGLKIGADQYEGMRLTPPNVPVLGRSPHVKAIASYEIYAEGQPLAVPRSQGLFGPVDSLDTEMQLRQVVPRMPKGYMLVDEDERIVGLHLNFVFIEAEDESVETVAGALKERWGVIFKTVPPNQGDGRGNFIRCRATDQARGFEIEITVLWDMRMVEISKIRSAKGQIDLD